MSTDRINNFKKLMCALVIDPVVKFMRALCEQRSRVPGHVAEEGPSDDEGQNLLKPYLEVN